ncbi:LamG domain-containing protein [Vallicoccus soli]|uniref:LamG domain-containing protein n=1 Tax=Vallicoccus soli TaxID=2339232 RepID=A0A3A3Z456_9ACTN|nr:LamG domain-containing protein [Vallicoccus soli]RJK98184.1 LamG domain-containing protein [Vallicoccus soli]
MDIKRTATTAAAGLAAIAGLIPGFAQPAAAETVSPPYPKVTTYSAHDVLHGTGVVIHSGYSDTSYQDGRRTVDLVDGLGVSHVRDAVMLGRPDSYAVLKSLAARGIRSNLLLGGPAYAGDTRFSTAYLDALRGPLAGTYESVEQPNEYDCKPDASWLTTLKGYSANLVRGMDAAADLAGVPVLGPSFCRPESVRSYGALPAGVDVANLHSYPQGKAPELAIEGVADRTRTDTARSSLVVTESGYHNATGQATRPGVTEAAAADYLPRLLLNNKLNGVKRTYVYELMDEKVNVARNDPEQHFGLVRVDGTPKPAYHAVRNLLWGIAGGDPKQVRPSVAEPLTARITGGGPLLRSLAVARPDGGHVVALWLADARHAAGQGSPTVEVDVALPSPRQVSTLAVSAGNRRIDLGTRSRVTVGVTGQVTLLQLLPAPVVDAVLAPPTLSLVPRAEQLSADGATLDRALDPGLGGWTGTPAADGSVPSGVRVGATVTARDQVLRVSVPGKPTRWTVEVYAKASASSADTAPFLQVDGAPGAQLRTYKVSAPAPVSNFQFSAFGLGAGTSWGQEIHGQGAVGRWHHLAMVNDGSVLRFYVDGLLAGQAPSRTYAMTTIRVGSPGSGFRGSLADLTVFPTALPAATVLAHATSDDRLSLASTASPTAPATAEAAGPTVPSGPAARATTTSRRAPWVRYLPVAP